MWRSNQWSDITTIIQHSTFIYPFFFIYSCQKPPIALREADLPRPGLWKLVLARTGSDSAEEHSLLAVLYQLVVLLLWAAEGAVAGWGYGPKIVLNCFDVGVVVHSRARRGFISFVYLIWDPFAHSHEVIAVTWELNLFLLVLGGHLLPHAQHTLW